MAKTNKRYILAFLIILLTEVLIALYVHDNFVRPYIGDVLVILLVYCFLRIFLPPSGFLPLGVFLFAVLIELAQAIDLANRLGIENNRILSVALGNTFDLADILCYAVGGLLVFIWQRKQKTDTPR